MIQHPRGCVAAPALLVMLASSSLGNFELCYAPGCHSDLAWSGGRWLLLLRCDSHHVVARRLVSSSVCLSPGSTTTHLCLSLRGDDCFDVVNILLHLRVSLSRIINFFACTEGLLQ